jgi:hypothetical protein
MTPDIPAGLEQLELLLNKMLELVEWQKISQPAHQRRLPPAFQLQDHIPEEMNVLYGTFLALAGTVHEALKQGPGPIPVAQHEQRLTRLRQLEQRVHELRVTERYKSF